MKKGILVDFNKQKSYSSYQNKLVNTWGFENSDIVCIFDKYKHLGKIEKYKENHYKILREILDLKLQRFSNEEDKEAYISSKKIQFLNLCNEAPLQNTLNVLATIMSIMLTIKPISALDGIAIFLIFISWAIFSYLYTYFLASPKKAFYANFFEKVEKKYLK